MFVFGGQYKISWLFTEVLKTIDYLVCEMETLLMRLTFYWIKKEMEA